VALIVVVAVVAVYLSICLSASLKTKLFHETTSVFEIDNIKNAAILRDFLNFWTWQRQKRKNSARLPHSSKLTTSKTKQFCETSSVFELDNIKNERILRDFLNFRSWQHLTTLKRKQFCETSLRNGSFLRDSRLQSWLLRTKKWGQVIRSAAPKTEVLMLQNATSLRKSAPGHPNISDYHVFCAAVATRHASLQIFFKCPTPATIFGNATKPSRFAHFWQGAQSHAPATRKDIWTSRNSPNMSEHVAFLTIWLGNVLRHNGVHFFDISTSKSGPNMLFFEVFWTFYLGNALRAKTACTFSTCQLPKVVRHWGVLYILTWNCFSRHNNVHLFVISTSHLCFSFVHVVRSLISKLPSIMCCIEQPRYDLNIM